MTDPLNWASDTNYPAGSDPWSATATKVAPSAGQIAAGFAPTDKPPAQWFNYILQRLYLSIMDRVTGPGSSTDNAIARFDGTGGKAIKNSGATLDGSGTLTTANVVTTANVEAGAYVLASNDVQILGGSGEFVYAPARTGKTKAISPAGYMHNSGWAFNNLGNQRLYWSIDGNGTEELWIDLTPILRAGQIITGYRVRVDPGAARATTNRMSVLLRYIDPTSAAVTANAGTAIGSQTYDNSTGSDQWITVTGLSHTVVEGYGYQIGVYPGAGDANVDAVGWAEVTFTDPGPRNY